MTLEDVLVGRGKLIIIWTLLIVTYSTSIETVLLMNMLLINSCISTVSVCVILHNLLTWSGLSRLVRRNTSRELELVSRPHTIVLTSYKLLVFAIEVMSRRGKLGNVTLSSSRDRAWVAWVGLLCWVVLVNVALDYWAKSGLVTTISSSVHAWHILVINAS